MESGLFEIFDLRIEFKAQIKILGSLFKEFKM
jgi:hypothetical protein